MDILELGAQLLSDKQGVQIDSAQIQSALSSLLGDGSGNIDLAGLASKMTADGGLADVLSSWLGDGANAGISADSVLGLLGEGQVAEFARMLGTDTSTAASGRTSPSRWSSTRSSATTVLPIRERVVSG